MLALNSSLAEIDWQALFDHCNTENDDLNENTEFAELLRLTVLQLCNIHCPKKAPIVAKTSTNRNISGLHRKRRKMKTRLHCLQIHQPHSSTIPYLQEQLSLLQLSIRDSITEELSKREQKAVDTIKSNPHYFYSYAKRFSKLRSNVGPLKDENGSLQHQPKTMADILQTPEANSREPVSWSSEEISVSRGNFLGKMQSVREAHVVRSTGSELREGGSGRMRRVEGVWTGEEGGRRREEGGVELKKLMSNQYSLPSFCIECFIMY